MTGPGAMIVGLGVATPSREISQKDAAQFAIRHSGAQQGLSRAMLERLYRNTRVEQRGSVLLDGAETSGREVSFFEGAVWPGTGARLEAFERFAPQLAVHSAVRAMNEAGCQPTDVTHVITVSCTGMSAPGVDCELVDKLGLRAEVARVSVCFMGCAGGIAGLRLAKAFVEADAEAVVLMTCVELCSAHFQRDGDVDQAVANALFADGAASCVIRAGANGKGIARVGRCSTRLLPGTRDVMSWRIGDEGFKMTLAGEVPSLIEQGIGEWAKRELSASGLEPGDIRGWCVHPGGPKILNAVERGLGLLSESLADARQVLSRHGNMSSTTVFFVLDRVRSRVMEPCPAVLLGFSPGLTAELAVLEAPAGPV